VKGSQIGSVGGRRERFISVLSGKKHWQSELTSDGSIYQVKRRGAACHGSRRAGLVHRHRRYGKVRAKTRVEEYSHRGKEKDRILIGVALVHKRLKLKGGVTKGKKYKFWLNLGAKKGYV